MFVVVTASCSSLLCLRSSDRVLDASSRVEETDEADLDDAEDLILLVAEIMLSMQNEATFAVGAGGSLRGAWVRFPKLCTETLRTAEKAVSAAAASSS